MRRALETIRRTPGLELRLIVTGMHLSPQFGLTLREVEASRIPIAAKVDMLLASDGGAAMARGIGLALIGMTQALEAWRPDLLLVLGDRGEMLAGALAAVHMNIPVAHVHGGDLSGTVDENVRHAISKLSHIHLAATPGAAGRLRRMGEDPRLVFCVGAPGLDDILRSPIPPRGTVCRRHGIPAAEPYFLIVQHPVVQEAAAGARQLEETLAAVVPLGRRLVICLPNADAGHSRMREVLKAYRGSRSIHLFDNLPRADYLGLLAGAEVLVGNSSSGIIEAASLGTPVVNVGTRQALRERNPNVLDAGHDRRLIGKAVRKALHDPRFRRITARRRNAFGDGRASERIARVLRTVALGGTLLSKTFRP
ncbi:MAG: UDP-N-acetylglucosamine 2-epimerase (hydrolyzing) [Elusimicrobia bacterium]|nr:UDP-N-acetylglucosamine 2-epimerase (hydrolyzing) [Elusimicrobiota bacterium]